MPQTPVENVFKLVETVRNFKKEGLKTTKNTMTINKKVGTSFIILKKFIIIFIFFIIKIFITFYKKTVTSRH